MDISGGGGGEEGLEEEGLEEEEEEDDEDEGEDQESSSAETNKRKFSDFDRTEQVEQRMSRLFSKERLTSNRLIIFYI
jgi:hypothetical protein